RPASGAPSERGGRRPRLAGRAARVLRRDRRVRSLLPSGLAVLERPAAGRRDALESRAATARLLPSHPWWRPATRAPAAPPRRSPGVALDVLAGRLSACGGGRAAPHPHRRHLPGQPVSALVLSY